MNECNTIKCVDKKGKQINIMFDPLSFDETNNHQSKTYNSLVKMANDYNILASMLNVVGKILYYLPLRFKSKLFIDDLKKKSELEGYIIYDTDCNETIGLINIFKLDNNEYNIGIMLLQAYQNRGLALPILLWLIDKHKDKILVIKTLINNQHMIKVAEKLNFVAHSEINIKIIFYTEKCKVYKNRYTLQ
jgi:RimJ/RimL family protein N-acetyltransferase